MEAAARSAMMRLSSRSGVFSGSRAAAPTGGLIPEVVRPAAPRTPPLRHAAVGNLASWQRFSTDGRNKTDSVMHMVRKWSKDCAKNARKAGSAKSLFVCSVIVNVASVSFTLSNIWSLKQTRDANAHGKH